ncbi:ubiquitin hydrolase [Ceratocystis lukuohia]|uniref:ubiquitinyl hydrolase 1 n=1 Tax=Ceratocystis lukuohia TaxID=2019550 RepID=A0ABR4MM61_9PEZI
MNSRRSSFSPHRMRDQTSYASRLSRPSPSNKVEVLIDRLSDPQTVATIAILLIGLLYSVSNVPLRLGTYRFTLRRLFWHLVVALIPGLFLQTVDRWLNPTLDTTPMTLMLPHANKSDALSRILGLDKPGGVMASVTQARRRLSSVPSPFKPEKCKPPGLGNWDNSCYQNSVLQGLSSLASFPEYLSGPSRHGSKLPSTSATQSLLGLVADLNSSNNNGTTLWTPGILKSMNSRIQQDAQEYFSKLLDEIDEELLKVVSKSHKPLGLKPRDSRDFEVDSRAKVRSKIVDGSEMASITGFKNPLEGLVAQRVACVQCGYSEGLSMIPFICLTLNLGTEPGACDLYQRLDAYTSVESIEGVHCAKCTLLKNKGIMSLLVDKFRASGMAEDRISEHVGRLAAVETALEDDDFDDKTLKEKCKIPAQNRVSSTKTKQMVIARPPRSLVIHINRSVFDERTFMLMKNPAPVRFPVVLDLGPWCIGSAPDGDSDEKNQSPDDEERWITKADASMAACEHSFTKVTGPIYELRAVVTHQGRHDNGHYVCYRKHSGLNKLELFEQSRMAEINPGDQDVELENIDQSELFSQEDWWRLSDETVTKCSENDVLNQGGAFMLFYDCVDEVPVRTAALEGADSLKADQSPVEPKELTTEAIDRPFDREISDEPTELAA